MPNSFSSLSYLHTLDRSYNQLSGSLPPFLTTLPRLKVLVLASNNFTNNLKPVSSPLFHLDLKMNQISGQLPLAFPATLRYLSLSSNSIQGTINALETLTELTYIDLSMNQFSGPIPSSLFGPTTSSMFLQRNNFTTISNTTTISLPQGSTVDLSHNSISGELPPTPAGAESLFLNTNRFTGDILEEYVTSLTNGTTKTLFLHLELWFSTTRLLFRSVCRITAWRRIQSSLCPRVHSKLHLCSQDLPYNVHTFTITAPPVKTSALFYFVKRNIYLQKNI